MPPLGFETTIAAGERHQATTVDYAYALSDSIVLNNHSKDNINAVTKND
jgi:hypothetical protein